jgi:hypothetical protein
LGLREKDFGRAVFHRSHIGNDSSHYGETATRRQKAEGGRVCEAQTDHVFHSPENEENVVCPRFPFGAAMPNGAVPLRYMYDRIRIISMRKATRHEQALYFQNL